MQTTVENPDCRDRFLTAYARSHWRGLITLRRLLRRPEITVRTRYGALLTLRPEDYIDRIVLNEGFYESEVFEALRTFFAPGAVLWDIGANLGLHCLSAALTEPTLQIHAFEPSPEMYARLLAHTHGNHAGVRCWPMALGDHDGTGTLYRNESGNPGMTTLLPGAGGRYDSQVQITLARADSLVARGDLPAPNVIKLDVEGSESAVLTGMGELLFRPALRAVVFETRADLLVEPTRCPSASLLLAAGFEFQALPRLENSSHILGNFLATRPA